MNRHIRIGSVDFGIIDGGSSDVGLQIIRHHPLPGRACLHAREEGPTQAGGEISEKRRNQRIQDNHDARITLTPRAYCFALRDVPAGLNSIFTFKWVPITACWYYGACMRKLPITTPRG